LQFFAQTEIALPAAATACFVFECHGSLMAQELLNHSVRIFIDSLSLIGGKNYRSDFVADFREGRLRITIGLCM
jgi:hypothetical protein